MVHCTDSQDTVLGSVTDMLDNLGEVTALLCLCFPLLSVICLDYKFFGAGLVLYLVCAVSCRMEL